MRTVSPPKIVKRGIITWSEYRMVHMWVEKHLGKPKSCQNCGTEEDRRYHWSNISGNYLRDLMDWRRLCVPCHSKMDGVSSRRLSETTCKNGHKLVEGNFIWRVRREGRRERRCLPCARRYSKEQTIRNNLKAEGLLNAPNQPNGEKL